MPEILAIPGFRDPVSSFTHLVAAGVFLILGVVLVRRGRGTLARTLSLGIYAFSCVFLLSMSGVFHLLPNGPGRDVLQRLDHAGIFALIAGTFTPIHVIMCRGFWRWGMLGLVWTAAITGIVIKTVFFDDIPYALGVVLYLGMGWVGFVSMWHLGRRFGIKLVYPMVWGGVAYTVGALCELFAGPVLMPAVVEAHELFHVAVLFGIAFHWRFVWTIADGSHVETSSPPNGLIELKPEVGADEAHNAAQRLDQFSR